jgi:CHAD domain-containing protein
MRFHIDAHESVRHGLKRVVRKECRAALKALRHGRPLTARAVHSLRKSLKRLRAVSIVAEQDGEKTLRRLRRRLTRVAGVLSPIRDVDVARETLRLIGTEYPHLLTNRATRTLDLRLRQQRRVLVRAAQEDELLDRIAAPVRELCNELMKWTPRQRGVRGLRPGLEYSHQRARNAVTNAEERGQTADFHVWRKRISTLRYQLMLLAPPRSQAHAEAKALDAAVTLLGDDHNLMVLTDALKKLEAVSPGLVDIPRIARVFSRRTKALRREARTIVGPICGEESDAYVRRVTQELKRRRSA